MVEIATPVRRVRTVSLFCVALALLALLAGCGREPAPVVFHSEGLPDTLSAWQLFEVDDNQLVPNAGVVRYELNTPLFTDYAHKLRTVWMPAGSSTPYNGESSFDFPVGTILSKTFYYPRLPGEPAGSDRVVRSEDTAGVLPGGRLALDQVRLIETRLLVRREDGWLALPYVWNDEQSEARLMRGGSLVRLSLVDAAGESEPVAYAVPDQNQCAGCHVSNVREKRMLPIGPTARNLNRDLAYLAEDGSESIENQLQHWQRTGMLTGVPEAAQVPRMANWRDEAGASLDGRARAYLDANCAHCHSPRGPGNTSGMWLGSDVTDLLRLGRCKLPIAAGQGTGNKRYGYVPGDPDGSILTYRIESNDPGVMMPELGRSIVHREGAALIRAWIAAQDGACGIDNDPSGSDPANNNNDSTEGMNP